MTDGMLPPTLMVATTLPGKGGGDTEPKGVRNPGGRRIRDFLHVPEMPPSS